MDLKVQVTNMQSRCDHNSNLDFGASWEKVIILSSTNLSEIRAISISHTVFH